MIKQKIEIEADIPEGYEATGEYRRPKCSEWYLCASTLTPIVFPNTEAQHSRIILRRKEPDAVKLASRVIRLLNDDPVPSPLEWEALHIARRIVSDFEKESNQ